MRERKLHILLLCLAFIPIGCFAKEIKREFGTFSIPDSFVESKKYSTDEKGFYLSKDDDKAFSSGKLKFANNVSVSKEKCKYQKENHISFRQSIVKQLSHQCQIAGFDLTGDGYYSKQGYIVYKFIMTPSEELLKTRPQEPITTQYYIVTEDYFYILVHETASGDTSLADEAAELIASSFSTKDTSSLSAKEKQSILKERERRSQNELAMKFRVTKDGVLEQFTGSDAEVAIPTYVKVIGQNAFRKTLVEKVTIPSSVVEIQKDAFADCQKIKHIVIPQSVERLGEGIFRQCLYIEKVYIGGCAENIPDNMFAGCSSLKDVSIAYGVKSIGKAFTGCTSLETIEIPDTVESIADFAFSGCSNLKTVILPDSIKIGRRAFYGTQIENREILEEQFGKDIFY
ncbi:MAG: leucine-rich repeat domain-containing protein [Treponema sp.]|uniref:leucine-rich repeat domain-containing protein n=1 Tax=Treponema sp. TaxID=166 RepID=UPI0025EBB815|nr:leucine-rich repeat domain-containing protein [Treponema sp.]MBQ8680086.1 leucine-rich repeat domain-containing protein [Treponema sp.]